MDLKARSSTFKKRYYRCKKAMDEKGIDILALFPSANMAYMTGFRDEPGERLLLALISGHEEPIFIVPRLYEEHVKGCTWIEDIRSWRDGEDPRRLLEEALRELHGLEASIALDTRLWARFFLMFLEAAPKAKYSDASVIMDQLRMVKSKDEIEIMERGFRTTDKVMEVAIDTLEVGSVEKDIANVIAEEFRNRRADGLSFEPIVGSGPNGALPHYTAGGRRIERGDAVVLDFGAVFEGYCTDITRTVFVKKCSPKQRDVYKAVLAANESAFRAARPGAQAQEVDRAARARIGDAGYLERFTHRTGHGIGMEVHEEPYIVEGNERAIEPGMVFSIEPGIYLPGKFGVRIEDIVAVGREKGRRLDRFSRELIVV